MPYVQVYLHLVDPNRDRAMMNKSDNVLTEACGVPPCWYEPGAHKGMTYDQKAKRWVAID